MAAMSRTQIVLLAVAGYFAVVTLVRLMLARRRRLAEQLHGRAAAEARRKKAGAAPAPRTQRKAG